MQTRLFLKNTCAPVADTEKLYSAEIPGRGNPSHRTFLLRGPPADQDPCEDVATHRWEDLGHVSGMRTDQWSIDATFFNLDGALYMVYAGSPLGQSLATFHESRLFIVRMANPTQVATAPPVEISRSEHRWEWEGDTGVNEGPEWLEAPDGSWKGIVYSAGGTWTQNYKMVLLQYLGGDPQHPGSWRKGNKPFLVSARGYHGPFSPGHGNFVTLGDETLAVFHATNSPTDGMENRIARCQRVAWTKDGPFMDNHVGIKVANVEEFQSGPDPGRHKERKNAKDMFRNFKAGYKYWTSGW